MRYETGDISHWRLLRAQRATICERAIEVITGWHAEGRWIAGGKHGNSGDQYNIPVADGNYQVPIQVSQMQICYYNADGTSPSIPIQSRTIRETLCWQCSKTAPGT